MDLRTKEVLSCLLTALLQSLLSTADPSYGDILCSSTNKRLLCPCPAAESLVRTLPSLCKPPVCCCRASGSHLGRKRVSACLQVRLCSRLAAEKLKPISPSQHFQQELSSW